MNANDVYNIAKALQKDELIKLYDMLKSDVIDQDKVLIKKNKKKQLPKFTIEDGIKYLINNHIKNKNIL